MHLALPSVMAAASCVCAGRAISPRVCVTAMNMAELTEVGAREKKVKVNEREREGTVESPLGTHRRCGIGLTSPFLSHFVHSVLPQEGTLHCKV